MTFLNFIIRKTTKFNFNDWCCDLFCIWNYGIMQLIKKLYHINHGVIQEFPALREAVTTHAEKCEIFLRVFDITNQLLTRHSPFVPLGQVDEWTAKLSPFSIHGLWLLKHWKIHIAHRKWLSNFPRRGRKPKYEEKKRKLGIRWVW